MSETISIPQKTATKRKPRAWWQWVLGIALIGFATYSFGIKWVIKSRPDWFLRLTALRTTPLEVPAGMKEADAIPASHGEKHPANVLVITLDTTRADRIGCYGNKKIETSVMDQMAKEGVLFSHAYAPAPTTLPSHCSIMTGLHPYHHKARANAFTRLSEDNVTLAEVLSARGYRTGGFISAAVLNSRYGIGQGFGEYDDQANEKLDPILKGRDPERRADHTTDRAITWLRKSNDKPFFAWVHYFDPHQPYIPPPGFAEKYAAIPYDGEIAFVDSQIGRLLDALKELKVSDDTLIVLIADHGQGCLQHLELTHGLFVYDATLHVPFIMKYGNRWGGLHIRRPVSSVDIMPTVLSLLGIKGPERCDGEDLTRPPAASPRPLFGESLEGLDEYAVAPLQTVREGPMKYIHAPIPELYDLSADPDEENNIIDQHADVAQSLKDKLTRFYDNDLSKANYVENTEQLTTAELQQLKALGYAGMEGGALVPGAGSFPDPKTAMRVIMQCERAWDIKDEKGMPAAIEHIESVVREDPNFYASQRLLSTLLMDAKEFAKAIKPLEKCLELHPDIPFPFVHMARARLRTGQTEKAIEMYDKAIKACPDLFAAQLELGRLFLYRNQPALAVNHLLKAFVLNPTDQSCAEEMAMAMAQTGRAEEAISNLRERLHADPNSLAVRNALCGLLIEQNKCEEVIPLMREGLKQNPDSAPMANNLAYAIVKCKRPGDSMIEAAVMMERVCQKTSYQSPEYLRTLGLVYAELLRIDEAITVSEKALKLAEDNKQADLSSDLRGFIAAFRELKARGVNPMNAISGSGAAKPPASQPAQKPH